MVKMLFYTFWATEFGMSTLFVFFLPFVAFDKELVNYRIFDATEGLLAIGLFSLLNGLVNRVRAGAWRRCLR